MFEIVYFVARGSWISAIRTDNGFQQDHGAPLIPFDTPLGSPGFPSGNPAKDRVAIIETEGRYEFQTKFDTATRKAICIFD